MTISLYVRCPSTSFCTLTRALLRRSLEAASKQHAGFCNVFYLGAGLVSSNPPRFNTVSHRRSRLDRTQYTLPDPAAQTS
uniref:Secreted protein n=1 Tax=Panagrellus redivivus TaxID=6233 RepID=A0A7E4ZQB1_PANRE